MKAVISISQRSIEHVLFILGLGMVLFAILSLGMVVAMRVASAAPPDVSARAWEGPVKFQLQPTCERLLGQDIGKGVNLFGTPTKTETQSTTNPETGEALSLRIYHFNLLDEGLGYVMLITEKGVYTIIGYAGAEPAGSEPPRGPNPFKEKF